jgi:hypothetical protein
VNSRGPLSCGDIIKELEHYAPAVRRVIWQNADYACVRRFYGQLRFHDLAPGVRLGSLFLIAQPFFGEFSVVTGVVVIAMGESFLLGDCLAVLKRGNETGPALPDRTDLLRAQKSSQAACWSFWWFGKAFAAWILAWSLISPSSRASGRGGQPLT